MAPVFHRQINVLKKLEAKKSILDVGCGIGLFLSITKEIGWHVQGIEKNPNAARLAKKIFDIELKSSTENIKQNSFSVLRFSHVLEHVSQPVEFIELFLPKLAADGIIVVIVPNGRPLTYSIVNMFRKVLGTSSRLTAPMSPGHHVLGFTNRSLRHLFEQRGMKTIRMFNVSMGNQTYFPMLYDGLMTRLKFKDIDLRTLIRYWLPMFFDNIGNSFGRGQWIIAYFKK